MHHPVRVEKDLVAEARCRGYRVLLPHDTLGQRAPALHAGALANNAVLNMEFVIVASSYVLALFDFKFVQMILFQKVVY